MEIGPTILVVDDEPGARQSLQVILEDHYQVLSAESGQEALQVLQQAPVDLILLDVHLPGMDGIEAAAAIKRNPDTSEIPIIALSAYISEEWQQKAFDAGIRTYLTKPAPPQTIKETIKLIMDRESASRQQFNFL